MTSAHNPEHDYIALAVHDRLLARDVHPMHAALIGQQVLDELARSPGVDELYVVKIVDTTAGEPHACVMRRVPACAVPLYQVDVRGLRIAARRAWIAELRADLAMDDDGPSTRI